MDALEFIKERQRMHHFYYDAEKGYCSDKCPACNTQCLDLNTLKDDDAEYLIKVVEDWSTAHPRKTRQEVFLEQYPNAVLDKDGVLRICPSFVGGDIPEKYKCICLTNCDDCRREFWMGGAK